MVRAPGELLLEGSSPVEVRPLSDGRAILLDVFARRLVMVDSELRSTTAILDATNPQPVAFPSGPGHLIAAKADTTYVLDVAAQTFRVVAPSGKVVRRVPADTRYMRWLGQTNASPAFDVQGRLVYADQAPPGRPVAGLQPRPDFFTLARVGLDGGRRDSLGVLRPNSASQRQVVRDGRTTLILTVPLVDVGDAWAMTSDGAVAMIRASDFHVDWIHPDGRRESTLPVRWPWHRYTRAELDSLRASAKSTQTRAGVRVVGSSPDRPPPFDVVAEVSADTPAVEPAFAPMSAMGDLDGRVWVRLGSRARGPVLEPSVYGIIDRSGAIVDRVQFPPLRSLAGFAPDGVVYVVATSRGNRTLERYRYAKP